jgi:exo-1,4-beta-D-glucosaminidase
VWLRNHPSLIAWYGGSDLLPRPELERRYLDVLEEYDPTRPYVGSAAMKESEVSGPTGMKMNGPYAWVPPVYWYVDDKRGGAFGFNTETGPGAQPPPLSSLKRMIPAEHLWPPDDVWDYHCARGEFGSIPRYLEALRARYGGVGDVETFCRRAQIASYEAMRGMLEAFGIRKHRATGVIQWMLNSAWPKIYWQFYDHYLMPTGAFYAARAACRPIHVAFDHATRRVHVINDTLMDLDGLDVTVRLTDAAGREAFAEQCRVRAPANSSTSIADVPEPPDLDGLRFLDLRLASADGTVLSENVYWLPERDDAMDFENTKWFVTPVKEYADLTALADLPPATLDVSESWEERYGERRAEVALTNASDAVAFGVELCLLSGETGGPVLPVFWDDNYLTLFPGQERAVTARFAAAGDVRIAVSGWNVAGK